MAKIQIGGDPESYMDAPTLSVGGGGGPSFIASILDALGIHRQVAKGPKSAGKQPTTHGGRQGKDSKRQSKPQAAAPDAAGWQDFLTKFDSAIGIQPFAPLGIRSADQNNSIKTFDPDTKMFGPL